MPAHEQNIFHAPQHGRQHGRCRRQSDTLVGPIFEGRDGGFQITGGGHQDLNLTIPLTDAAHEGRGLMDPVSDNHPGRSQGFELPKPFGTAARRYHQVVQGRQRRRQRLVIRSIVNDKNRFFHHRIDR